ncbi:MAG: hypothetical protein UR89_C0013G0019 [Candidatus Roizmanbacteria bacterium GW2011_GWA2_35_8]|uniref:Uncharacterized protein n=1 Tax=Candidatus Roizmanbacteria bacterium GW2011_GWA2_35_8 TaxID=1618479 RepID=A0A0G0DDS3_9BACT|nr:MAG: hypothetical protein UR89_C0013G0019 [Candidatus Roizmanbacteria bacterium GW2011_GWA2_35_8]
MRKTKINLIVSRQDYERYEGIFYSLKVLIIVLILTFTVVFISFFIILNDKNKVFNKLTNQKQFYLTALQEKKGDEAKIFYMQKKYSDLKTFLKDDAFSAPYYKLLTSALKESTESSNLESFEINKDRKTSFTITFTSFPELVNFFKFVESEAFIKNFENISLKSFSIIGNVEKKENYELSFNGIFTQLKEINNE